MYESLMARKLFLTKGVGRHKEKLQSFELALRDAGIAAYNIVRVSSIFPPGCKEIPKAKGLGRLRPGQILFCVISDNATNEPNRLLAASLGIAIPGAGEQYGYLSEHHAFGQTDDVAGDYAEDLAATMLATTLGIEFDPNEAWDQRKKVFYMGRKIVKTKNITQSAVGDKKGLWTTVLAAAVLLMDDPGR